MTAQVVSSAIGTAPQTNYFNAFLTESKNKKNTFEIIYKKFEVLSGSCQNAFKFDHEIEDEKMGQEFWKVLEIKAQQPNRFVEQIQSSTFEGSCHLGFTRKITIKMTDNPVITENVLIQKNGNGEIKALFIQDDDNEDFFACLNHVYQNSGKWHFGGIYLYGRITGTHEGASKVKEGMFKRTFEAMLKFAKEDNVNKIYESLEKY
jgi:hypothetical protein